jgi:hypothetical protein
MDERGGPATAAGSGLTPMTVQTLDVVVIDTGSNGS